MKLIFTLLFCLSLVPGSKAQSYFFENEGFEKWDSSQGYINPLNWYSLNVLTTVGFNPTLEMTTNAHSGNYGVLLVSKDNQSPFPALAGVLSTGPIINASGNPDFTKIKLPYPYRPTRFQYYYHADPEPGDTCLIALILTKWNLAKQQADTIGTAFNGHGDSSATYTLADLEISYRLPLQPDSIFIIISSSADPYAPMAGSKIYLDDFKIIGGNNGLEGLDGQKELSAYPNPASGNLYVESKGNNTGLKIYSLTGQLIFEKEQMKNLEVIDVSHWNKGIYFLQMNSADGGLMGKKVIVE